MKTISVSFLDPAFRRVLGETVAVQLDDDGADLVDVIAGLDARYMTQPVKVKRGNVVITSLLRFTWNPTVARLHGDVGIEARDKDRGWLPLLDEPFTSIPDGSTVLLTPDPGC